jgi:hypothetical protein
MALSYVCDAMQFSADTRPLQMSNLGYLHNPPVHLIVVLIDWESASAPRSSSGDPMVSVDIQDCPPAAAPSLEMSLPPDRPVGVSIMANFRFG